MVSNLGLSRQKKRFARRAEGLAAEAIIDRILEVIDAFKGDAPQGDDMTCVVVRVEESSLPDPP